MDATVSFRVCVPLHAVIKYYLHYILCLQGWMQMQLHQSVGNNTITANCIVSSNTHIGKHQLKQHFSHQSGAQRNWYVHMLMSFCSAETCVNPSSFSARIYFQMNEAGYWTVNQMVFCHSGQKLSRFIITDIIVSLLPFGKGLKWYMFDTE